MRDLACEASAMQLSVAGAGLHKDTGQFRSVSDLRSIRHGWLATRRPLLDLAHNRLYTQAPIFGNFFRRDGAQKVAYNILRWIAP